MGPGKDQVQVGASGSAIFIRITGRGTFKVCPSLKQYCLERIEQGSTGIVIDFDQATGMDSTFMGVLAGLARKLGGQGHLAAVNLGPRTTSLLETLGLDQVVQLYQKGSTPGKIPLVSGETALSESGDQLDAQRETAEVMLEAHQELVDLTPENLPRFKDVLSFIQEDLKNLGNG